MKDCLFCKILSGKIPATIEQENDKVIAFRDIHPQAPTHILIIPREHISSTLEINRKNANILIEMSLLAQKIVKLEGIDKTGYRWVINTGIDGGQSVYHIHLHLLGGRKMNWPPG